MNAAGVVQNALLLAVVVFLWRIDWNTRQRPVSRPWWNRAWRGRRGR
jgi:hypothetical protein